MFKRLLALLVLSIAVAAAAIDEKAWDRSFQSAERNFQNGNYREAYDALRSLLAEAPAGTPGLPLDRCFLHALDALQKLDRIAEYDDFLAAAVERHGRDLPLLIAIARADVPAFGQMIDGKFVRGAGASPWMNRLYTNEYDRAQKLQTLAAALPAAAEAADRKVKREFFLALAELLRQHRQSGLSYRLQEQTALDLLPAPGDPRFDRLNGAPIRPDGEPVFYGVPASFAAAKSDGERFRWALRQAMLAGSEQAFLLWAQFLDDEFGIPRFDIRPLVEEYRAADRLRTLPDSDTLAVLADGDRRLTLPDQFNPIKVLEMLTDLEHPPPKALEQLAELRNRREQYGAEVQLLRRQLALDGDNREIAGRLKERTGNHAAFQPVMTQVAGRPVTVELLYRNAPRIDLKLYAIDQARLLARWQKSLSRPAREGEAICQDPCNCLEFLETGKTFADCVRPDPALFSVELAPPPGYRDAKTILELPVKKPGMYLLEGEVPDGTRLKTLLWVNSLALFERDVIGGKQFFAVDIAAGRPLAGVELEVLAVGQSLARNPQEVEEFGGRVKVELTRTLAKTDAQGAAFAAVPKGRRIILLGRGPAGDRALIPSTYANGPAADPTRQHLQGFLVTDAPLYRPGDTVSFQLYIRRAGYGPEAFRPEAAGKTAKVTIQPPYGEPVELALPVGPDAAVAGSFALPPDAALGLYRVTATCDGKQLYIHDRFRVEEFQKPEYLLTLAAPTEPIRLGEEFRVDLEGKYYFGAPVAGAELTYKVEREQSAPPFFYRGPWHWLFGDAYWRCLAPFPSPNSNLFHNGRELLMQGSGVTDADGRFRLAVPTDDRFDRYVDRDCVYLVTATIADSSRRIITQSARIPASRRPFRLHLWTRGGFFTAGEPGELAVAARKPDGSAVAGTGYFTIRRRAIDDRGDAVTRPEVLRRFTVAVRADREPTRCPLLFNQPGIYEIEGELEHGDGGRERARCLVRVAGRTGKADGLFSELPLELARDREVYAPGETVKLLVSSRFAGATVFLFPRAETSRSDFSVAVLKQGAAILPLPLLERDQPNTFVRAILVHEGKLYREDLQIPVPPRGETLELAIDPIPPEARPGSEAQLRLTVTDRDGHPAAGPLTVAVYDQALEDLAGGSNAADIRRAFRGRTRQLYNYAQGSSFQYSGSHSTDDVFRFHSYHRGFFANGLDMSSRSSRLEKSMVADNAVPLLATAAAGPAAESAEKAFAVREDFRDRLLWIAEARPDADGVLTLPVRLPDNLTTWKIRAWALTDGGAVGSGENVIVVSKEVIARLEMPRFLVAGDTVEAVATIHNYRETAGKFTVTLAAELDGTPVASPSAQLAIPAGGTGVRRWTIDGRQAGAVSLTLTAAVDGRPADAVRLRLPIEVNGVEQEIVHAGVARPGAPAAAVIEFPAEIRPGSAALRLELSSSVALPMLRILPYLAGDDSDNVFSIACRYLPAFYVRNALGKTGIDFAALPPARDPKLYETLRRHPLSDPAAFEQNLAASLRMLTARQNSDGGWGWFSGFAEQSYPDTSAFVVEALLEAQAAGLKIDENVLKNGLDYLVSFLRKRRQEKANPDNLDARLLQVLTRAGRPDAELAKLLYRQRASALSPLGLALLGQSLTDPAEIAMILRNLDNYAVDDAARGTAYLKQPDPAWRFFWYGDDTETQANYLRLLLARAPEHPRIAPLARYLAVNLAYAPSQRSLRSLATGVKALAEYLKTSDEGYPRFTYTVKLDGAVVAQGGVTRSMEHLSFLDAGVTVAPELLTPGRHELAVEIEGEGALSFQAFQRCFNLAETVEATGTELKISRRYYLLKPRTERLAQPGGRGQLVGLDYDRYLPVPLADPALVRPGDLVEVELNLDSGNDYDYVTVTDPLPAGFVPLAAASGPLSFWPPVYAEYRTQASRFHLRTLQRGPNQLRYRLRAQLPGRFTALPAAADGVYAPALHCSSEKMTIKTE